MSTHAEDHFHSHEDLADQSNIPQLSATQESEMSFAQGLSTARWLLGTWTGNGTCYFPSNGGERISYSEEASFAPVVGRSAIMYSQVVLVLKFRKKLLIC
jgi:hypothetical protein